MWIPGGLSAGYVGRRPVGVAGSPSLLRSERLEPQPLPVEPLVVTGVHLWPSRLAPCVSSARCEDACVLIPHLCQDLYRLPTYLPRRPWEDAVFCAQAQGKLRLGRAVPCPGPHRGSRGAQTDLGGWGWSSDHLAPAALFLSLFTQRVCGGGAERGRVREDPKPAPHCQSRLHTVSTEPDGGLELTNCEIVT